VFNRIRQLTGLKIRGGWGMTDTASNGTSVPKDFPEDKLGTIGIPLPGCDMAIVDLEDPTRRLGPNEPGEIIFKGAAVTREYWNMPEETAAAFVDGYLLTGDIGYMDEDGYFYIVDRIKDLIITNGYNVYPRNVEEAIYLHPAVEECIVAGLPDANRGEIVKAWVKLKEDRELSIEDLKIFLKDKLSPMEMPKQIEFRAEPLPKTMIGKLSRKDIVAQELNK